MAKTIIAPSILASNFLNLQKDLEFIENSEAEWIHIDIMDGVFVPNISFGPAIVHSMKKHCTKIFDVHLMVTEVELMIEKFAKAGADRITVHLEACPHLHRTINFIHSFGIKAGVALNPHSNISQIDDILGDLDLILIMSVNPGFGGQKFIEHSYDKIKTLKNRLIEGAHEALIEVDGGVNLENASKLIESGADVLVAGSSIFKSNKPQETIKKMHNLG